MRKTTVLASASLTGALIVGGAAVPSGATESTEAGRTGLVTARTCVFDPPGAVDRLRVKLRMPIERGSGGNDIKAVRVRATDDDGRGRFRDRRVSAGRITISLEHKVEKSNGGLISSAQAVRRHGSPATWRMNPDGVGANVERVVAQVVFRIEGGRRVVANCAANL